MIHKIIKRIAHKRLFPVDSLYYRHRLLSILGHTPILVYTMGKVGSTTVYYTLRRNHVSSLVYHVHCLTDPAIEWMSEHYKKNNAEVYRNISLSELIEGKSSGKAGHLSSSYTLKKALQLKMNKRWLIITLVRDPVAIFFSSIFQNPDVHARHLLDKNGNLDKKKIEAYCYDYFMNFIPEEDNISGWFEKEFYNFTGVDIYKHEYDAYNGYCVIQEKSFDIAVLSLENLDKNLTKVVRRVTNFNKKLNLINKRIRDNKDGNELYHDLKRNFIIPKEGLNNIYSTRYATHFYTEEFRMEMIDKWSKPR